MHLEITCVVLHLCGYTVVRFNTGVGIHLRDYTCVVILAWLCSCDYTRVVILAWLYLCGYTLVWLYTMVMQMLCVWLMQKLCFSKHQIPEEGCGCSVLQDTGQQLGNPRGRQWRHDRGKEKKRTRLALPTQASRLFIYLLCIYLFIM